MPGARCTRSLACESTGNVHTSIHSGRTGNHPASPHALVLTVSFALSSVTNSSCHRRRRIKALPIPVGFDIASAGLTPATGAGTTRLRRPLQSPFVLRAGHPSRRAIRPGIPRVTPDAAASTASRPASVTIAKRPFCGTRRRGYRTDLGRRRTGIFLQSGLDRISPSGKSLSENSPQPSLAPGMAMSARVLQHRRRHRWSELRHPVDRSMKPIVSRLSDLILRSKPSPEGVGLRLEGWPLALPSFAAILRDASLTRCPQDEVQA
jgi:hypothetical protein